MKLSADDVLVDDGGVKFDAVISDGQDRVIVTATHMVGMYEIEARFIKPIVQDWTGPAYLDRVPPHMGQSQLRFVQWEAEANGFSVNPSEARQQAFFAPAAEQLHA